MKRVRFILTALQNIALSSVLFCGVCTSSHADFNYNQVENDTLAYFQKFLNQIDSYRNGSGTRIEPVGFQEMHYLTAVYLYCSMMNGVCPVVLEALFETDLINMRISPETKCNNLMHFWDRWIKNEFEQRLDYGIKTAYITKVTEFRKNVRPKFIRCSDTVKAIIKANPNTQSFFNARYAPGSPVRTRLEQMLQLLDNLKTRKVDVFVTTGAVQPQKESAKKVKK